MSARSYAVEAREDLVAVLREAWAWSRRRRWWLIGLAAVASAAVLLIWPHDYAFERWIAVGRYEGLGRLANHLRRWGDFRDSVTISAFVFLLGVWRRRRAWRRAAVACFTAACLAGLAANVVRFSAGRPRPKTDRPDGFYGPTLDYSMQSFPSGHSTTSTANAVALALALPAGGWPALVSAGGVVWGCLYTRTHYPSDVAAGMTVGLLFAIPIGLAARRLNRLR